MQLGQDLGLDVQKDEVGNVLIRKPATKGMENRVHIVLQSHLDMVCQKNNETIFDFEQDGIKMQVDGDWVRAEGTTLGADNGIGVAAILGILASKDIPHPSLEALFTIDEETGMTGALGLKGGFLEGDILLNLDTEDDDELSIGCAGGVDVTSSGSYEQEEVLHESLSIQLTIKGGAGGHSGMDIQKGIANVNKVMNRVLLVALESVDFRIASIRGGGLRNAIPRESTCQLVIAHDALETIKDSFQQEMHRVQAEHRSTDPELCWELNVQSEPNTAVMAEDEQELLLLSLQACPVGIHRMSPEIEGLVQTSNNLAQVTVGGGLVELSCLCRSSVDSEKDDHARSIASAFALAGLETGYSGDYPGWTPNPGSAIVSLFTNLYVEKFGESPRVLACHAGLECGILGTNYPNMDMVSFGPNIRGAHSPDECVQISSVQKFWGFFLEGLKRIPVKA
jgi:dipeptidase D